MKKFLKIILIVFVSLIILILGFLGYFYLKQEYKISKLPDYYQDLAKKCEELDYTLQRCCIESIKGAAENNWELEPETGCPEEFQVNMLRCAGSYRWCEPISELVCEADSDCVFHYTAYSEDHLCPSCFYADEEWICMNIEKAEEEFRKTMTELHGMPYPPFCERCFENDYDLYSCKCVDNKCAKSPK